MSPAIKKIDSDGAEVAGIARYLLARIARIGYSKALLLQYSRGLIYIYIISIKRLKR